MLIVLTLRGPLIAPVVWATLEMDVIVQVGADARGMCKVDTSPSGMKTCAFQGNKSYALTT